MGKVSAQEDRFPSDLGVKEDIVKNLCEICVLAQEIGRDDTELRAELRERLAALKRKDGDISYLQDIVRDCRELNLGI